MLLLLAAAWWSGVLTEKPNLEIRHLLNAETIALEQYGVVLKPGKLMSHADVTHVQQGFLITIPEERPYNKANFNRACQQFVRAGLPDISRACNKIRASIGWMHLTSNILRNQFREVVVETLLALQKTGEETATFNNQDQKKKGEKDNEIEITKNNGRPRMAIISHPY